MPVLPLVGSTISDRPGSILPSASAASIIDAPIRSLTEPAGLKYSSLATTSAARFSPSRLNPTIGVLPTASDAWAPIAGRDAVRSDIAAQPTRNRARSEAARTFASLSAGNEASSSDERTTMSIVDKATGRIKKAAGDLAGNAKLRREGSKEERKGEAKEERDRAHEKADKKAQEVADLDRKT